MRDPEPRGRLAGVVRQLAAAVQVYGRLAATQEPGRQRELEAELDSTWPRPRTAGRAQRGAAHRSAAKPVGWPLRGELVSHLDRLRKELLGDMPEERTPHRRARSWRRPLQAGRGQPRRRPAAASAGRLS